MEKPRVAAFFDPNTWTVTYVVFDERTHDALIIDPVLDYDPLASQTSTTSADQVIGFVDEQGLHVKAVLETHAHADHLTASRCLAHHYQVPVGIGRDIGLVQATFVPVFGLFGLVKTDGSQFDRLLEPDKVYQFGSLELRALNTKGHTPACMSYLIGDAVFTGDALFMHDYGTGRTDFPAGSAEALYHSVHEVLYSLPDDTRVFVGHDYQPGGREPAWESTIGKQKAENVQLNSATSREDFVKFRNARDRTLSPPRLLYQSIQVNAYGGYLPPENASGVRHLRLPINRSQPTDDRGAPLVTQSAPEKRVQGSDGSSRGD